MRYSIEHSNFKYKVTMPQSTLEYTANITQHIDWAALFADIHQILVQTVGTALRSCKSRVRRCDTFFIGDNAPEHAFVYLDVHILSGRDKAVRAELSQALMAVLQQYFAPSLDTLQCQLSVNVSEIDSEIYSRHTAS